MDNDKRNRLLAAIITFLLMCITVGILVSCGLHYEWPPDEPVMVELKQDSIMFGGEYVMLGNTLDPTESDQMDNETPENAESVEPEPNVEGDDLEDAGEPAKQAPPVVTAKAESPMKVKEKPKEEKPKKTGPVNEAPKTSENPKVKRGEDATPRNDRVKDAFGKSSGTGTGKQGSTNGNSNQGALSGKPGIGGLDGYTLEKWATTTSRYYGSVTVKVTVNNRGKVIEARAIGGSGEAWRDMDLRRRCEDAAKKCQFSVPKRTTTEGHGTLTFSLWP
ncbi:MAG: hypothetical protein J6S96_06710 [Muribaculaceae bacterium]|nr:hypothetical protein [Muribaculaceae bacterium]